MTRNTNNSAQASLDMDAPCPSHPNFNIHISPFLGDPKLLESFISQINEVCASNKYSAQDSLTFAKSNWMVLLRRSSYKS